MQIILRNIAAVIVGFIVGSAVNMALVMIGPVIIPPPEGVDMADMESLAAHMPSFGARHFLFPFLAHALGTFCGVLVACKLAVTRQRPLAYALAILFLTGGIFAAMMIPAPLWFIAADLLLAYLPMAWLALVLTGRDDRRTQGDA